MNEQQRGESPANWRAWVWQGGDSPLHLVNEEIEAPRLQAGQALVRNAVIGLNPVDWKVLGDPQMGWHAGHVPGVDGAGTVVAVGEGVPETWLGERVAYHQSLHAHGSFAEYTPIMAHALMRVPDAVDFAVAASFPCPALTAWQALEKIPARPAQHLLISGAGGSVGHYLVQLAKERGFRVSVMCNPRHASRLSALGADECLDGPLTPGEAWLERDVERFYAVIDCVNEDHAARLAPALLANGHLVCIQGRVAQWPTTPFGRSLSLHEVALGATHVYGDRAAWARLTQAGEGMLEAIATGRMQPEQYVVHPFSELGARLEALKNRRFFGKSVIGCLDF
ncbi:zinc-binding dehydrogenase [Paraburkholderia sp. DHOC27]|uniref:zinc-binding dehydrogenase n=1 Tax=Paraburkholderia sp. DHOC27 TaxID=2303330 RepID=UPI000E3B7F9A|nr:zinc-binding dehydrogenase [Paraburkholderia sp. DHOC27]RFU49770.1 alcohol dehydrogenase [Paraburkholderia sp. DHOC27]